MTCLVLVLGWDHDDISSALRLARRCLLDTHCPRPQLAVACVGRVELVVREGRRLRGEDLEWPLMVSRGRRDKAPSIGEERQPECDSGSVVI